MTDLYRGTFRIVRGDVARVAARSGLGTFDAVLCDPPYGLKFMGKAWDHGVPSSSVWANVLDRLRPGGHLIAFGGTRTFHRLGVAIEDAGFEIRDCLSWLYGQGFPKSLAIDKAIDRVRDDRAEVYRVTAWIREARDRAGLSNRQIDEAFGFSGMAGHWTSGKSQPAVPTIEQVPKLLDLLGVDPPEEIRRLLWDLNGRKGQPGEAWGRREVVGTKKALDGSGFGNVGHGLTSTEIDVTAPATPHAHRFHGYGTALKPAWEPAVLAMKPTDGTFAANAVEHGVAGLGIDASRIDIADGDSSGFWEQARAGKPSDGLAAIDRRNLEQGYRKSLYPSAPSANIPSGRWPANVLLDEEAADELGDASRFFYTAKASPKERHAGLEKGENKHPTLKPVRLAEYLAKLLLPPAREDGQPRRILVPFSGVGSEVAGCLRAGWDEVVGIELEPEYVALANRRVPALLDL